MPRFTRETAAIASIKGNASRWSRPRVSQAPAAIPEIVPELANDFALRRLNRVREQLDKLDALASGEKDTKRLKELADATTRLSEQERILAGRPLPGSRRPKEGREPRSAGWIELQPALPGQLPATSPVTQVQVATPARPLGWEYDDPNATPREPDKLPGDVTP
jgi:hypothetical protein